jgi:protein-tyrosine phosphatase
MLRRVQLPSGISGSLFLDAMPGRRESLVRQIEEISGQDIARIVCLASLREIAQKSPDYKQAIASNSLPCEREVFEIPDFGVPQDREKFLALAKNVADWLRQGEKIMIHCGAGIGRTGTLAVSILLMLGSTLKESTRKVSEIGSHPETADQRALVKWISNRVHSGDLIAPE